jgi:hypothetical protein
MTEPPGNATGALAGAHRGRGKPNYDARLSPLQNRVNFADPILFSDQPGSKLQKLCSTTERTRKPRGREANRRKRTKKHKMERQYIKMKETMEGKPSDYVKPHFIREDDVPKNGGVYHLTNIEKIDKLIDATGKREPRIRLTLDGIWWFELAGPNLENTIGLLGDDFKLWYGKRIGLIHSKFENKKGELKHAFKVVPAPEIGTSTTDNGQDELDEEEMEEINRKLATAK